MKNLINEIVFNLKRSQIIVLFSVIVFVLGLILGVIIKLPDEIYEIHIKNLYDYYNQIFVSEKIGLAMLLKRVFSSALVLLLVLLLSLSKFSYYLNFIVLFYRAFVLGLAGRLFISNILITGAIMFLFLILINALFLSVAIIVFMAIIFKKVNKIDDCSLKLLVRTYLISLIVSVIGCVIEFVFIITLFRPLNLIF